MKLFRSLYSCALLLFLGGSLSAQNNWVIKKEKEGIVISTRPSDHSAFNDIQVEMDLPGNIYQMAAILMDVEKYEQWAYATKKSKLIKRISLNKLIYYSEFSAPWPVSNRDLFAVMEVNIDSVLNLLQVNTTGQKNYLPSNKDLVRIPYSRASWKVSTVSGKVIHLVYFIEIDPGGSVPGWIMNLYSTKGPFYSFKNLKSKMTLLNPKI